MFRTIVLSHFSEVEYVFFAHFSNVEGDLVAKNLFQHNYIVLKAESFKILPVLHDPRSKNGMEKTYSV